MEVGVRVEAEDLLTGRRRHTNSCYLTFVAVDRNGRPIEVPGLEPETEDEQRRYAAAETRRRARLRSAKPRNGIEPTARTTGSEKHRSYRPVRLTLHLSVVSSLSCSCSPSSKPIERFRWFGRSSRTSCSSTGAGARRSSSSTWSRRRARADEPQRARRARWSATAQALAREIDGYQRELEDARHSAQGPPSRPRRFPERDGRPPRAALLAAR